MASRGRLVQPRGLQLIGEFLCLTNGVQRAGVTAKFVVGNGFGNFPQMPVSAATSESLHPVSNAVDLNPALHVCTAWLITTEVLFGNSADDL